MHACRLTSSLLVWLILGVLVGAGPVEDNPAAPKPLFRDPVYDGAADPVVHWNPHTREWWMFYTNRRANVPGLAGVEWVHGCPIGLARSSDGLRWDYLGTAAIEVPTSVGGDSPTFWAPAVVTDDHGGHHLFLTVVPGIFSDWNHPRRIVHLTSTDLQHWTYHSTLSLASDRVIDAEVRRLPDGSWRLWYNDERTGKSIHSADSPDLMHWTDRGLALPSGTPAGEGPCVFRWQNRTWMLVDHWHGLGVYSSDHYSHWSPQPGRLLATPGTGPDDGVIGGHADVVVQGDRAYLYYFTHPGRRGPRESRDPTSVEERRSSLQVTELFIRDGELRCDRDRPVTQPLLPPSP